VVVGVSLTLMAAEAPVLHEHSGDTPGFYDEACPLAQLVASSSVVGLTGRVDLGYPSPAVDLLALPARPAASAIDASPFEPRGPPLTV
jgi:hypothetical protein